MSTTRDSLRHVGVWNHARAVMLLPLMNVVAIPATILAFTLDFATPIVRADLGSIVASLVAVLVLLAGTVLVARCIALFVRYGDGTLAPWDPTQRLIARGPYRYVRNPMKAGLFLILIGECLLLRSPWLVLWTAAFILVNVIYIQISEEPGLRARFGRSYADYCAAVPRWWPRLSAARGTAPSIGAST